MGRKVSDGKAFNFTCPDGEEFVDGELYRVGGLNGFVVGNVAEDDDDRTVAAEAAHDFIHSIHVPSGVNPDVGDVLYWNDPSAFQYGADDLVAAADTAGDAPCFFVTGTKVNGCVRGRVLNGVTGDADVS